MFVDNANPNLFKVIRLQCSVKWIIMVLNLKHVLFKHLIKTKKHVVIHEIA